MEPEALSRMGSDTTLRFSTLPHAINMPANFVPHADGMVKRHSLARFPSIAAHLFMRLWQSSSGWA